MVQHCDRQESLNRALCAEQGRRARRVTLQPSPTGHRASIVRRVSRTPTLNLGDSGPSVTYLQEFLGRAMAGSMTIPPDVTGHFDEATQQAVKAFQAGYGLEDDGVVGRDTWAVIQDVDPQNWEVGSDNNPLEMAPLRLDTDDAQTGLYLEGEFETRTRLWGRYYEVYADTELAAVLPIVEQCFEIRMGYALRDTEFDPHYGYPQSDLEAWFEELATTKDLVKHEVVSEAKQQRQRLQRTREEMTRHMVEDHGGDQPIVALVACALGGATHIPFHIFDSVQQSLEAAESLANDYRLQSAVASLHSGAQGVESLGRELRMIYDDIVRGGERAVQGLEALRAGSQAVLVGASGGILGGAAMAAGTEFVYAGDNSVAQQLSEIHYQLRESFELTPAIGDALKAGLTELWGGVYGKTLGSWLKGKGSERLAASFARSLGDVLGGRAGAVARYAADKLIDASGDAVAETAVGLTIIVAEGERFPNLEGLAEMALENLGSNLVESVAGDLRRTGDAVPDEVLADAIVAKYERLAALE